MLTKSVQARKASRNKDADQKLEKAKERTKKMVDERDKEASEATEKIPIDSESPKSSH